MEEPSSVQYYYSSGSHNPPPDLLHFRTLDQPAASEFFHHSPHHAYHPFDNVPTQPPPSSTSTTYDLMAANLASSSSSSLINFAGYHESVSLGAPRYDIQDGSCDVPREQLIREMEYTTSGGAMYHNNSSFHGGYSTVGGMVNRHEGLSLSLASNISNNPQSEVNVAAHHFGEGYDHRYSSSYVQAKASNNNNDVVLNDNDHGMKFTTSRSCDKSVVGASYVVRTTTTTAMVGPLGPFTGYATILKSSRFLKPAQELLEEWCGLAAVNSSSSKISRMEQVGGDVSSDSGSGPMSSPSAAFYGSNDGGGGAGSQTYRPEFHEVKARLLYLLEEVCKRYKQYHQQMQMVVSSFESVAGLSSSTPYVALAIKAVSRNFKSMKHAISDQLKHARARSGEEELFSSSSSSTSTRLRSYMGQQRQGWGGGGPINHVGFLEPQQQQQVWRTQRGLPERSVAILRAWLFEHFLHPYPTDADKHMLATQAGLTRNQVSNWFINARVRVWKPMVEEIHMLESKGQAETSQSKGNNAAAGDAVSNSAVMGPASSIEEQGHIHPHHQLLHREQYWKQEKRSRLDFQVPDAAMSNTGSLTNFLPYQQGSNVIDHHPMVGGGNGNGAVSLTLGLRHGVVDNAAHQQQLQRHRDQLRRQFGDMRHDFLG